MNFLNSINDTINDKFNSSYTENGALGFRTTGKELLDLNFAVSSLRRVGEAEITKKFSLAFFEDPMTAIKWLFYACDIREGLGERRLFKVCITYLATQQPDLAKAVISLIPEYSRWDNLWCLLDTDLKDQVIEIVKSQLNQDLSDMNQGKPISLLAKWMKSLNASSAKSQKIAKLLCSELGYREKNYRKTLSSLRGYLKIVERDMSAKKWSEIDYSRVPSRANLIYSGAFLRNDEVRRREFLAALERGDANVSINAGVLFPHDIVHKYIERGRVKKLDTTLEQLWQNLPNVIEGDKKVLVVADGSGSMLSEIDQNSSVTALEVANALAIYFGERNTGEFKDTYLTFSSRPQLVNMANATNLHDKLQIALLHNEVADTNIEATFYVILTTAVKNHMAQSDLPNTILIISDMEFNEATGYRYSVDGKLFESINRAFKAAGYTLPRLVFWNVSSRTGTIPVKQNDAGVALVSGFSPNVCKMVMSGELDPYKCLLEQVNSERYLPIEQAIKSILKTGKVE